MNLAKLNPWNWFQHEDETSEQYKHIPVARKEAGQLTSISTQDPFLKLHQELDQVFNNVFNTLGMPSVRNMMREQEGLRNRATDIVRPNIDVSGNNKQYEVTLDVPGLSEKDLSLEINGDVLTIKGQKEEYSENKEKQFYRMERHFGSFQRTLTLPGDAEKDEINASLKDGVLTLNIPRNQSKDKDIKRIAISS